jgi:peroxiredoxin family protein
MPLADEEGYFRQHLLTSINGKVGELSYEVKFKEEAFNVNKKRNGQENYNSIINLNRDDRIKAIECTKSMEIMRVLFEPNTTMVTSIVCPSGYYISLRRKLIGSQIASFREDINGDARTTKESLPIY